MSAGRPDTPFVAQLRARPGVLRLGSEGAATMLLRVQSAELFDVLRVELPPETPVLEMKRAALAEMQRPGERAEEYVLKLNGFEVLDEQAPVSAVGARNGSTFLLANRRRQPVR